MYTFYQLKKTFLLPYTAYMRRKERHLDGFIKAALELHYYRPSFYKFMKATIEKPDIMHDIDLTEESIAFDIGAYVGDWARQIYNRYHCTIHAFEPNPKTFAVLKNNAGNDWTSHEYGVAGETEELQLSMNGMGSSVYELGNQEKNPEYMSVSLRAVDEAWQELGYATIDLMKINIEGGEFPLLERMIETGMMPKVRIFMIQFHEWHPQAHYRRWKIRRELRKTHRQRWGYHFVWEYWELKD